jgi:hypothetical protein
MADTKISALPSGSPALNTDLFPSARGGSNYSLTGQNISDLTVSNFTTGVLTWTPAITFGSNSTGIVYGYQSGTWVKTGSMILLEATIFLTSKGTSTGAMQITNLPFTFSSDNARFSLGTIRAGFMQSLTQAMAIAGKQGTTTIDVTTWNASGIIAVMDTNATDGSHLFISMACIAA